MDGGALSYDSTVTDGTARSAQRVAEYCKEDDRCDDTLEGEEVLYLVAVSQILKKRFLSRSRQ